MPIFPTLCTLSSGTTPRRRLLTSPSIRRSAIKRPCSGALEENAAIVSACNLAQISQFSGVTFDSLVFAGGGSKGALWSQILSDVTGLPVRVPVVREATALGCAIAAGTGAGLYDDMASTGERLVSWHREFTQIRSIASCIRR